MRASALLASAIAVIISAPELAFADCQTVSASDVAQDIQSCPSANNALKNNACNFGGAAIAESGGSSCASNGNNFGVLQLTRSNLTGTGYSPSQYLNLPAEAQVCIWAQQVGNSNTSGAYQTLSNSGSINGKPVTAGMLAACFQFGPLICKNDLAFMQANGGACPTSGSGGVRATGQSLSSGSANLDGNNQSICSWGQSIQNKINQAAATCNGSNGGGTNCPGGVSTPGGVIPPSPGNAPVSLPADLA